MKRILNIKIWLPLAMLTLFTACGNKYLDTDMSIAVETSDAYKSADDVASGVVGIYSQMLSGNLWGRNIVIIPSIMCDFEGTRWSSNAHLDSYEMWTFNDASSEIANLWGDLYTMADRSVRVINGGQEVLASGVIKGSSAASDTKKIYYAMGEAYALKALAHFYLVNLFAKHYDPATAATDLGIILIGDAPYPVKGATFTRSTVQQTYDLIHKDLDTALRYLAQNGPGYGGNENHASSRFYMNYTAVQALKAKVYMYQGNYENTISYALQVANNPAYKITRDGDTATFKKMYGNMGTPANEDLFTLRIDEQSQIGATDIQTYYTTYGGRIYKNVMDSAQPNGLPRLTTPDMRYTVLLVPDFSTLADSRNRDSYSALYTNKYPDVAHRNNVRIISLPEIYCMLAEAYVRTNNEAKAKEYIFPIANRNAKAYPSDTAIHPADLLNFIKWQTNFESIAEGRRFYDLRRWGVADHGRIPATAPYEESANVYLIRNNDRFAKVLFPKPFDLYSYALPIPQTEVNASGIPQNPRINPF